LVNRRFFKERCDLFQPHACLLFWAQAHGSCGGKSFRLQS
jgi:hypothetical protein